MKGLIKFTFVLICCYQITACTSLFVSTTPEKMYEGQEKNPEEISIIAGQNFRIKTTYWHQIFIEKIDGKNVYNKIFDLKFPHVVTVLPGKHEIQLKTTLGNQNNYKTTARTLVFVVDVEPGRAYQIYQSYKKETNSKLLGDYYLTHTIYTDPSSPLPPSIQFEINESMSNVQSIPNRAFMYIEDVGTVKEYLDYLKTDDAKKGGPYK